ncbi:glycosyltransferase family 39 protein [Nocardia crassostreae]|uniref:glycosyltransferase family 39 protein n=1 Tax=Nocardia crassostreae TaxID=53428 RepID=UPI00082B388D|nr:glycosyltransferase family 39 protein [Nocardia crassostreae]
MYWVAAVFAVVMLAFSNRYGYHRDKFYFLAAGRRLDWGYPDQPPLVPLIARAMSAIDADSLVLLRIPALAAATLVVICAGLMARELGGGRLAQTLAAAAVASAAVLMGGGHQHGTTIFDLAAWSVIVLTVLRLLRPDSDRRWWLVVGLAAGVGLQNKALLVIPILVLALVLAALGPREIFATKYFPLAIGLAALIWAPYLWWQAANGWPVWEHSRAIASGSSGTSDTPLTFVLLQFGLIGPLLVPLWIFGLWRLWRERRYRAFAVAYAVLFLVFLVTGGKAYYLAGMYPILLAAGAVGLEPRLAESRAWRAAVASVVAVSAVVSALLFLPVLPVGTLRDSPVLAVNYDAGEMVAWPEFVAQVAATRARVAPDAELLTANYGEAGAIEFYGARYGLPAPHSVHNSYWWWGPPADGKPVLLIGIGPEDAARGCIDAETVGRIDNGLDIDNEEQDRPLILCRTPRAPWAEMWPTLRRL